MSEVVAGRFELVSKTVYKGKEKVITAKGKEYKYPASWQYQFTYKVAGQKHTKDKRGFKNKKTATTELDTEIRKLEGTRGRSAEAARKDFDWLVSQCKADWLKPPVFRDSRTHGRVLIDGHKSYHTIIYQLNPVIGFFGSTLLKDIEDDTLHKYKSTRLAEYVTGKEGRKIRPISIATVNKELSLARRVILYGFNKGYLTHNPFQGAKVIRPRDEEARDRTLTLAEQPRLLDACVGEFQKTYERKNYRPGEITATYTADHPILQALITVAIESGFRLNELRNIRWKDIDETKSCISILPGFAKSGVGRRSILSPDARAAIDAIKPLTSNLAGPFADMGEIKNAWKGICSRAEIEDLQFRDLRSTFATRAAAAGIPLTVIGKLMGHSKGTITERNYIVIEDSTILEAVESLEAYKRRVK